MQILSNGEIKRQAVTTTPNRGTEVMEYLLLNQYQNSPNLKEYFGCFFAEMDDLFQQTEEVYFGRFLEHAQGEQLDKIGRLLNQERAVPISDVYFGFQGASGVIGGFSHELDPLNGGIFLSEDVSRYEITPLNDEQYRRLLAAVGTVVTRISSDINLLHYCTELLLGKSLTHMKVYNNTARSVTYELASSEITAAELSLIDYFIRKYLVTTGISFQLSRIQNRYKPFFDGTGNWIEKDDNNNLLAFGADPAQGEESYLIFKTKNVTADTNYRAILSSNVAAEAQANLSYKVDGGRFYFRLGTDSTENVAEVNFDATLVNLADINFWKMDFTQTGWTVSLNGTQVAYIAVNLSALSMNMTVLGCRYNTPVDATKYFLGSLWDIKHTGPNYNPINQLSFLALNEGLGSSVVYSEGYAASDWTIAGTPNWQLV